jgi:amino acid transporter
MDKEQLSVTPQKFGTFLGVYTPSVLTILGLIMYLRFGWVVGNIGLLLTIFIVLLSSSITFITGLSASAIATNMRVGVGGEYYMISHSLGLELGGAIGIPLYLCRTLSITFYSFGLAESLLILWPDSWGPVPSFLIQLLAAVIIIIITALSGKSAALVLKLQIPIMVAVGLSFLALFIGVFSNELRSPEVSATYRTTTQGFWYVFAVFFPAVTGFTAGIGMSGDLKDPQRSIPWGTLLAVLTGAFVYLMIPFILSISNRIPVEKLAQPGVGAWVSLAIFGALFVYPGIWGAILSSAFGSVLGGPRVLQALASDGLAPKLLSRLSKKGQPTLATWVSGAIALAAVGLGNLNAVAQFVTILFLTLYVIINLSAAIENIVGDPSYRPTINVPWYISLLGSLGAIMVMFLLNPLACIIAATIEILLYIYLRRRAVRKRWGDVRAGLWVSLARFALLKLRAHSMDPRNWRPHILVFTGDTRKRINLVRLASWFNQDRGVVTACQVITGDLKTDDLNIFQIKEQMETDLRENNLVVFTEVDVVKDFENGIINIAQANGIAGLQSNTIMFGWSDKPHRQVSQLCIMRAMAKTGKSSIIARINWRHEPGQKKRIDLWWGGLQNNGDMMLLLAYLLSLNREWKGTKIVLNSIVRDEKAAEFVEKSLSHLIAETRINAVTRIITKPPEKTITETIRTYSESADIVFIGLNIPKPGSETNYAEMMNKISRGLGTVIFVRNAGEFAGNLIDIPHER